MSDTQHFTSYFTNENENDAPESAVDVLKAILKYGELGCVSAERFSWCGNSGKKPATKEVWQFPRHMLTRIEEAIANSESPNRHPRTGEAR